MQPEKSPFDLGDNPTVGQLGAILGVLVDMPFGGSGLHSVPAELTEYAGNIRDLPSFNIGPRSNEPRDKSHPIEIAEVIHTSMLSRTGLIHKYFTKKGNAFQGQLSRIPFTYDDNRDVGEALKEIRQELKKLEGELSEKSKPKIEAQIKALDELKQPVMMTGMWEFLSSYRRMYLDVRAIEANRDSDLKLLAFDNSFVSPITSGFAQTLNDTSTLPTIQMSLKLPDSDQSIVVELDNTLHADATNAAVVYALIANLGNTVLSAGNRVQGGLVPSFGNITDPIGVTTDITQRTQQLLDQIQETVEQQVGNKDEAKAILIKNHIVFSPRALTDLKKRLAPHMQDLHFVNTIYGAYEHKGAGLRHVVIQSLGDFCGVKLTEQNGIAGNTQQMALLAQIVMRESNGVFDPAQDVHGFVAREKGCELNETIPHADLWKPVIDYVQKVSPETFSKPAKRPLPKAPAGTVLTADQKSDFQNSISSVRQKAEQVDNRVIASAPSMWFDHKDRFDAVSALLEQSVNQNKAIEPPRFASKA